MTEMEEDYLICNNPCFICFQPIIFSNKETISLVNFLFDYLRLGEEVKFLVCEECGVKLAKFRSLCNALENNEKVRLEMDVIFYWIRGAIQDSNKDLGWAPAPFVSSRDAVMRRCRECIWNPKPAIVLEEIDPKFASQIRALQWNDSSPSLDNEDNDSSSSHPEQLENPAIPEVMEVQQVKMEFDWGNVGIGSGIEENEKNSKQFHGNIIMESVINAVLEATFRIPKPDAKNSHVCEICEKSFDNLDSLKRHKKYMHFCRMEFPCDICKKIFRSGADLERHVFSVHEKQRYYCQVPGCTKSYSQRGNLNGHCKLAHPGFIHLWEPRKSLDYRGKLENGGTVFECRICECKFKSVGAVKIHIERAHGQMNLESEASKGVQIENSAIP